MIYDTGDGIEWTTAWYHKVYLFADRVYLYYWGTITDWGSFRMVKSDTGTEIFNLTGDWCYFPALVVIEVAQSGYYNLTITSEHTGSTGFTGTGFFEIDELILGQFNSGIGFPANNIAIAYYTFGTEKSYTQSPYVYSKYLYWGTHASNYAEVITPSDDPQFSENPIQFNETGKYIIYDYSTSISPITEYQEQSSGIPGFELLSTILTIVAIFGIISLRKKSIL